MKAYHWFACMVLIAAGPSWAQDAARGQGSEAGNGGNGIRIGGKVYSLDLVEAGVEANPYFDKNAVGSDAIQARLAAALKEIDAPIDHLAGKIEEIRRVNQLLAFSLIKVIEMYDWRLVNKRLIDCGDEESPLEYAKEDLVQLATRSGRSIRLSREDWVSLDDDNRVAVILHEVSFAAQTLSGAGNGFFKQSSPRAREINGYFFTKSLSERGPSGLATRIGDSLFGGPCPGAGGYTGSNGWTSSAVAAFDPNGRLLIEPSASITVVGGYLYYFSQKSAQSSVDNLLMAVCREVMAKPSTLSLILRATSVGPAFFDFGSPAGTRTGVYYSFGFPEDIKTIFQVSSADLGSSVAECTEKLGTRIKEANPFADFQ